MNYTKLLMEARRVVTDNAPMILTGLAVSGVVTTTVLAVKATPDAMTDIWNAQSEQSRALEPVEKIKLSWRYYVPTALMGGATIACIVAANTVSTRRNAALAGLVSLTETSFREYREQVIEKIGEKPEREIRDEVAKKRIDNQPANPEIFLTGAGEHLCFDMYGGRYFRSDIESIRKAENDLNAMMVRGSYASLNEFYDLLNLEPTSQGEIVGWSGDPLLELQFTSHLSPKNEPVLAVDFKVPPTKDYYKGWQ